MAPDTLVVLGPGQRSQWHAADTGGSLADYGVPLQIGPPPPVLPLSLTVARWLGERASVAPARYLEIAADEPPEDCLSRGADLASAAPRVAALVMGDGSARRTEHAPGPFDERAVAFDTMVARSLETADTEMLAGLDPVLSAELMVGGRPAWQTLAGAARGAGLHGQLLAHEAPYGVGYFAALWS